LIFTSVRPRAGVDEASPPEHAGQALAAERLQTAPYAVEVTPLLQEIISGRPTPQRRDPGWLGEGVGQLAASSLLAVQQDESGQPRFVVHPWTATEIQRLLTGHPHDRRAGLLDHAHQAAADFWRWRVTVWPQDWQADVHNLLEARHHHLAAGQTDAAEEVTEDAFATLRDRGEWDTAIARGHRDRLPSPQNASPIILIMSIRTVQSIEALS
jgi:hypothetical protein